MDIRRLAFAVFAAAAFWSTGAKAQPNDAPYLVPGNQAYNYGREWERYNGPFDRRWYRERERGYMQDGVRGAGPNRDLRIGQRVPRELWRQEYLIRDWRGSNLLPPPRGYQWFQAGADLVLVDMTSGVIAQVRLEP